MSQLQAIQPPTQSTFTTHLVPFIVGALLGTLQTGLFFQLTFMLSSGFTTYLFITLCWLFGGGLGAAAVKHLPVSMRQLLIVMLAAYAICTVMVSLYPFDTHYVPIYCLLIGLAGVYPGVFFARSSGRVTAHRLFFWENNGFIAGLVVCTVAFMLAGRLVLWVLPGVLAVSVWLTAPSTAGEPLVS